MGTHSGHGTKVCQFGVVHSRCRCIDETYLWIQCPTPEACAELTGINPKYTPKHRKDVRSGRREVRLDS